MDKGQELNYKMLDSDNKSHDNHKSKEEQLYLKQSDFEIMQNLVGPSYILSGFYGILLGVYMGTRTITFKNRPLKLITTSMLNLMGRQMSNKANAGGALVLLFSLTKKSINFMFDDDMEDLSKTQKHGIYGFVCGALFKSSKGFGPSMLFGSIFSGFCMSVCYMYEKKYFSRFL